MNTIPEYNFKEGDRVMVKFTQSLVQPGIAKHQSNQYRARTDVTEAITWKVGTITMLGLHGDVDMAEVVLDKQYKTYKRGWVMVKDRLQPYLERML